MVSILNQRKYILLHKYFKLGIETNKELEELNIFLTKAHDFLEQNGHLAIISFHSLEDRIVKNYFKDNKVKKINTFE